MVAGIGKKTALTFELTEVGIPTIFSLIQMTKTRPKQKRCLTIV
jgi:hypothetical protein